MKATKQAIMDPSRPVPAGRAANLFRAMAENSSDMIIYLTYVPERRLIYVNPACYAITGYTPEEFYAQNGAPGIDSRSDRFPQFLALDDPDNPLGTAPIELCWYRKDGTDVWTEVTKTVIRDAAGRATDMLFISRDITRRKATQKALRESEERFATAFNVSPVSISISRLSDGRFVEVNPAFLHDKGFTRTEAIGHTSLELGLWNKQADFDRIINLMRKTGSFLAEAVPYRTKSGETRIGYLSGRVITLDGEPHILMHALDITKLKQTEEQLRLLSSITEQVSDATVVGDADLNIIYLNKTAVDLLGYTLDEATGHPFSLFNEKNPPKRTLERMQRLLCQGKPWSGVITKRRKDGRLITCACRYSPLMDKEGKMVSCIGIYHDITKLKETETSLQISKELVDSILTSMPEGVIVVDGKDEAILTNASFRRITGFNRISASGYPLEKILPVKPLLEAYREVKRGKRNEAGVEFRCCHGKMDRVISGNIIHMGNNRTLITLADISQAREEQEKLYLTDRLASIGQMAAGLAHELNNPLTSIVALSQMLLDADMTGEVREDVGCIHDEAKRAANIVRNVLLFTRNNNYARGHANANDTVRDVLRLREYVTSTGNITVKTELAGDLPEVPIDRFQLQQVFLNIVLNAEAAIEAVERPGLLTVSTQRAGNTVKITFIDNGCGIKKSVLPRIFDPFYTTKEIGKGTGLGLSICYGIIVKHGGKIAVKSEVGRGTTFTVSFPIAAWGADGEA